MPCDAGPSKQDVDTMARLACMFCQFLDTEGEPIPEWAEDWWERYQLDKLTPQEREP